MHYISLHYPFIEAVLTPLPGITWRTIGGVLDFYIILGDSPSQAVSQYIKVDTTVTHLNSNILSACYKYKWHKS